MTEYLLDSCALIAFFAAEPEAVILKEMFLKGENSKFYLNFVNYGEVIYNLRLKGYSEENIIKVQNRIKNYLDIQFLKTDDFETVELACDFKAKGGVSYFDAFILASAKKKKLTIVTKDQEFKKFEKQVKILWLK
ncbi:MAG: PIN domain-containing protein [bacterium]